MTNPSAKGEQESEICKASAIFEVSGKLNLLMNLNRVPLIVLGFFNFHFPIDLIRGQKGVQEGVSRGSVDRGSAFCRNPVSTVPQIIFSLSPSLFLFIFGNQRT